ncbi:hypothetical protein pb186bvf_010085 [Paramecium bursaria]
MFNINNSNYSLIKQITYQDFSISHHLQLYTSIQNILQNQDLILNKFEMLQKSEENRVNKNAKFIKFETLLIFRIIAFIYMTWVLVQSHFYMEYFEKNFLYFSLWGNYAVYFYFGFTSIENVSYFLNHSTQFYHDSFWKVTQLLYTIALVFQLSIFALFWVFTFTKIVPFRSDDSFLNINLHAVSVFLIIIDLVLNQIIIKRKHFTILLVICILYFIVNFGFVYGSEQFIYPGITWDNLISYALVVVSIGLVSISFWICVYLTEKLKIAEIPKDLNLLGQIQ